VTTNEGFGYFDLAEIQFQLEKEVQRRIDIGFIDSFRQNILENVKQDLKLIYERLVHIREAIDKIEVFVNNTEKEVFLDDQLLASAVLFQFSVIGKAGSRME
jgi:uncharacterized protein YfeS